MKNQNFCFICKFSFLKNRCTRKLFNASKKCYVCLDKDFGLQNLEYFDGIFFPTRIVLYNKYIIEFEIPVRHNSRLFEKAGVEGVPSFLLPFWWQL